MDRNASEPGSAGAGPADILAFWREAGPERWFTQDDAFDAACRARFLTVFEDAAAGRLAGCEDSAQGALALVLLLDQMPRNIFRGSARVWASDPLAREVAGRAIAHGFDREVDSDLRTFFYLPFMHGEDLASQDRSVALYEEKGRPENVAWARHHRDIVARFGRFPHRNAILGRESTAEELAYLEADGFAG
ncbi:DUF924 family protein [uncultured Enterovirga sp.]|uniref:DUF924 family protein n=1 Tax=uncultured Enterovirga sp. TaxID=2026352 RepID=UPI0035CAFF38